MRYLILIISFILLTGCEMLEFVPGTPISEPNWKEEGTIKICTKELDGISCFYEDKIREYEKYYQVGWFKTAHVDCVDEHSKPE